MTSTALITLLTRIVDYAGLFPPAGLAMPPMVANYAAYTTSPHAFMLGKVIVPATKLMEFASAQAGHSFAATHHDISALVSADMAGDFNLIEAFHAAGTPFRVTAVESKALTTQDVHTINKALPRDRDVFIEVALNEALESLIAVIADTGRYAKIRTGGETTDKFPTSTQVARFMTLCAKANVPFKATAGLHHPLRASYHLTYQPDSPCGTMHGFLNVFLAAAFIHKGMDEKTATMLLEETDASAFNVTDSTIGWREHSLNDADIASARKDLILSFGSCSFNEPVEDLKALGLL